RGRSGFWSETSASFACRKTASFKTTRRSRSSIAVVLTRIERFADLAGLTDLLDDDEIRASLDHDCPAQCRGLVVRRVHESSPGRTNRFVLGSGYSKDFHAAWVCALADKRDPWQVGLLCDGVDVLV